MGDNYLVRITSHEYARNLGFDLLEYINTIDFSDPDFYYRFRNNKIALFCLHDAINLQDYETKKLVELRYANGTIKAKTIQNNINFSLKLVDAIERKVFDPKELTKRIEKYKDELFTQLLFDEVSFTNFEYLVKCISTSSDDTNDFMSQYEHVLSRKHIYHA